LKCDVWVVFVPMVLFKVSIDSYFIPPMRMKDKNLV
jgi:hypothetical protein